MKPIKKIVTILICCFIVFSNMHIVKALPTTGSCGEDAIWTYDNNTH